MGIFYREAGPKDAPTIVLLHGFPSSSREFDTLIPLLATHYHLIAPDFPGFGQSEAPPPSAYRYTFDHLAETMDNLLVALKVSSYTLYIHDYGAPVGMRMILAHPERLHALISQNGNIYEAGLGAKWTKIAQYWADPKAHPEVVDAFLSFDATEQRHTLGTSHPERYNPDTWTDEFAHLSKPGQREIQADLLYDYRTNVASYPKWQAWLREHRPPTLVAWGANDPSFIGARRHRLPARPARRRDPSAGRGPFRPRREDRRDRRPHPSVHGEAPRLTLGQGVLSRIQLQRIPSKISCATIPAAQCCEPRKRASGGAT